MAEISAASLIALHRQLDQSQWWPRAVLEQHQLLQLPQLVDHAFRSEIAT